jgi:hypothetical protein
MLPGRIDKSVAQWAARQFWDNTNKFGVTPSFIYLPDSNPSNLLHPAGNSCREV